MDLFQNKRIYATRSLKSTYAQGLFLKRLGNLLMEGFSLKEALRFLKTTAGKETVLWINYLEKGFEKGALLHEQLAELKFSDRISSQIYFSMAHGNFSRSIYLCGTQLLGQVDKRKKLSRILNYPLMLVIFMIGMLLSMRYLLLPHISQITSVNTSSGSAANFVLIMIETSPYWLSGLLVLVLLGVLVLKIYLNQKTALEKAEYAAGIPLVRSLYQLYMSQYLAFEWSQLLTGGSSMKEITTIMKGTDSSELLQELGLYLEDELIYGREFQDVLTDFKFLKPEIKEIVQHGEVSGKLGKELKLYSDQCEEELQNRIEKLMEWIQPLVFFGIAVMIISIYAAILLPTFSLMEGL